MLHRNLTYTLISSVVTKFIVLPPGVVVELNRAQPSGHPTGTLINCNVNLIYWCLIGYKIYGDNYGDMMRVEVYGDDTRAYFKNHKNLINIDDYIRECGLKSEPVINNLIPTKVLYDDDKDIDFLKRRFNLNGIRWNHKKLFDKVLYQSKNRDFNQQVSLLTSYFMSLSTDDDVATMCNHFSKWIVNKHSDKIDDEVADTLEAVKSKLDERLLPQNQMCLYNYKAYILDEYIKKINLLSYSVHRYKKYMYMYPGELEIDDDKLTVLYCIGMTYDDIIKYNYIDEKQKLRPPPLSSNEFEKLINRYSDDFRNYVNKFINYMNSKI